MKHCFTILELLTAVAMVALLATLLLPALSHARECARSSGCASILKQYAYATSLYADEYDDIFPDIRKYLQSSHGFLRYFSLETSPSEEITRCPSDYSTKALGRLALFRNGDSFIQVSIGGTVNLSDSESSTSAGKSSFMQSRNDTCLNAEPSKRCQWTDYQNQDENKLISGAAMSIAKGYGSHRATLAEYVFRHKDNTANGAFCDGHVAPLQISAGTCPINAGHDISLMWTFPGNCTWPYGPRQGPPQFAKTIVQNSISF